MHPIHRRRRLAERIKHAVGVVLASVVALLLVTYGISQAGLFELPDLFGDKGSGGATAEPDGSGAPAAAPAIATPFEGTPTAEWGEFDALAFPEAEATKHFGKDEVADFLAEVRDLIRISRVDWAKGDADRDAFVRRFPKDERDWLTDLLDGDRRSAVVSELAEGRSLVAEPRVTGNVTVTEGTGDQGVARLEVHTRLVWAYPFDGRITDYGDNLLVFNVESTWERPLDERMRPGSRGVWLNAGMSFMNNVDCEASADGRMSAFQPSVSTPGSGSDLDKDKVYDPNTDLAKLHGNCPEK